MGVGFFCDWLGVSIPYTESNLNSEKSFLGNQARESSPGINGYEKTIIFESNASLSYSPTQPEKKINLQFSSQALGFYNHVHGIKYDDLIERYRKKDPFFTRIDLAKDDYFGELDLDRIHAKLVSGEYQSKLGTYFSYESTEPISQLISKKFTDKGDAPGRTIYLGNLKKSNVLFRFYDKKAEMLSKKIDCDLEYWVRCELQLRQEASDQFCNHGTYINPSTGEVQKLKTSIKISSKDKFDRTPQEIILYYLAFLEKKYKISKDQTYLYETHKRYWNISDWWIKFLETDKSEKIGMPKYRNGIESLREYWKNSMVGLNYLLSQYYDEDFDSLVNNYGKEKFEKNSYYKKILESKNHARAKNQ